MAGTSSKADAPLQVSTPADLSRLANTHNRTTGVGPFALLTLLSDGRWWSAPAMMGRLGPLGYQRSWLRGEISRGCRHGWIERRENPTKVADQQTARRQLKGVRYAFAFCKGTAYCTWIYRLTAAGERRRGELAIVGGHGRPGRKKASQASGGGGRGVL